MYKNIEKQKKLLLRDQVEYHPGQVVRKHWYRMRLSA